MERMISHVPSFIRLFSLIFLIFLLTKNGLYYALNASKYFLVDNLGNLPYMLSVTVLHTNSLSVLYSLSCKAFFFFLAFLAKCFNESSFIVPMAFVSFLNVLHINKLCVILGSPFFLFLQFIQINLDKSFHCILSGCFCGPLFIYLGLVGLYHQLN